MSITAKEAAEVAKAHGLTLSDASALSRLAESPAEADLLASMFSGKPATIEPTRDGLQDLIEAKLGLKPSGLSFDETLQAAVGYTLEDTEGQE